MADESERAETTEARASAQGDERLLSVWNQWLSSMATDAEAALSAAIAYRDMDAESRERWLDMLEADSERLDVPRFALFAPLLSVEHDAERRVRMMEALGDEHAVAAPRAQPEALRGKKAPGIYVLVVPLYLDFVQVLACEVDEHGFSWVRHDPIARRDGAPRAGQTVLGTILERTPMNGALDELASAVLAHRRSGRPLPEALEVLTTLLAPDGG